jgi:hypothetical protein
VPDLAAIAGELYAVAPEDFVAARAAAAARARDAGDRALAKEVTALRRPSAGAAAVNLLVRERPADLGRLLDLGVRLREAQAALAGADLRALHAEQQRTMAEVAGAALDLLAAAGGGVGGTARARLEGTLRAAMGDADAAAAVATGLLTRDLVSSGFEPVDVAGAVAVPGAPPLAGVPSRRTPMRAVPGERDPARAPATRARRRRGRLVTEPDPPASGVRAAEQPGADDDAPGADPGPSGTGTGTGTGTARTGARDASATRARRGPAARGGPATGAGERADAGPRGGAGSAAAARADRERREGERAEREHRAQEERAEREHRAQEERERRRAAARRAAEAEVATARADAEARSAERAAAVERARAAESRADELADLVRRTREEIDRLRDALVAAQAEQREIGVEVRHARSARTAAERAAERAADRLDQAERDRDRM